MDVVLEVAKDGLAVHLVQRNVYDVRQSLVRKFPRLHVFALARNSGRIGVQIRFECYEIFSGKARKRLIVVEVPFRSYRQRAIYQRKFIAKSVYDFESSRQAAFSSAAFRTYSRQIYVFDLSVFFIVRILQNFPADDLDVSGELCRQLVV